jgi:hypothetical protein
MPQSFKSHAKWDPMTHFVLMPLALLLVIGFTRALIVRPNLLHVGLVLMAITITLLTVKTRNYALRNQDRIIRLEEQSRLFRLMPTEPAVVEGLCLDQLIGLRFASDAEAPELARRAVRENLGRKQIKEAITAWRPDECRA